MAAANGEPYGAGRRAIDWPMLDVDLLSVAVRVPVEPAAVRAWSAVSIATFEEPALAASMRSVMPVGGVAVT